MSSEWIPGYMPALRPTGFSANASKNTWTRQKANYLRLKTIEIGYTFPKKWMQRAGIENLRVYVNSFNTATTVSYTHLDVYKRQVRTTLEMDRKCCRCCYRPILII